MKQDTRVDFNIYVLDPATDLNPKQFYTYVARLLKEAADQFAPIFWVFYRQSSPCRMANSKRNPNLQEG